MGMAEQFLNGAQFHAILQHGNRKRMAQHMRRNLTDTGPFRVSLDDEPEALAGKTLAMMIQEKRLLIRIGPGFIRVKRKTRGGYVSTGTVREAMRQGMGAEPASAADTETGAFA